MVSLSPNYEGGPFYQLPERGVEVWHGLCGSGATLSPVEIDIR
jgi:hypothetical protein